LIRTGDDDREDKNAGDHDVEIARLPDFLVQTRFPSAGFRILNASEAASSGRATMPEPRMPSANRSGPAEPETPATARPSA